MLVTGAPQGSTLLRYARGTPDGAVSLQPETTPGTPTLRVSQQFRPGPGSAAGLKSVVLHLDSVHGGDALRVSIHGR